ncbi:MAG: hypothetical protein HUU35_08810, partial [Armatimonadetes bacterium]|nr:hypothetical protein [Armatimonadota bacterium]
SPTRAEPARGGALGVVGIVLLLVTCVVGGGLLLRGDLSKKKQHEELVAELNAAFSGVSFASGFGAGDAGVVADDLEITGPVDPKRPMAFEGYLDGADGRVGALSGTWDRAKGSIVYSFHAEVEVDNRKMTVTGDGEIVTEKHGPAPKAKPAPKKK